jgi:plastocyanin
VHLPRSAAIAAVVVLSAAACAKTNNPTVPGATNEAPTTTAATNAPAGGACPGLPNPVNDHGTAAATGSAISLDAGDFFFSPTCERALPLASTITITIHNTGQALHNISLPAQGIDTDIPPGQTVTVSVKTSAAGQRYTYFCKYHRTSGMAGVLVAGGS